ncbi:hypothetical protein TREMEDRAFT_65293 [Tremella mesenterica DSM 1558]|uniref:uncharacterized protein n=1 Tax=Tremella mesenterica (strain ATCC 24925 / CBS 8224 / DSM 1558 / NBRC 9311 / NRRL Y-6157 / RJB 2259-6 / UBC 559-6) TaxID=578456 RepID=UPI00032CDB53|nr:uncharacterized protein TREMEDRAFT_65293 [Tremella mesenterica DSM 1558]EIW66440.1 hypothetical protein TREMEDRAFT_65293 [Tremella mesenterica DSM 1558]
MGGPIALAVHRGTLLTPRHVEELAEAVCEESLGKNWVGRFVDRHKDVLTSRFYTYQELARLKADKVRTKQVFYDLVCLPLFLGEGDRGRAGQAKLGKPQWRVSNSLKGNKRSERQRNKQRARTTIYRQRPPN